LIVACVLAAGSLITLRVPDEDGIPGVQLLKAGLLSGFWLLLAFGFLIVGAVAIGALLLITAGMGAFVASLGAPKSKVSESPEVEPPRALPQS
jgi:hypothetical protein